MSGIRISVPPVILVPPFKRRRKQGDTLLRFRFLLHFDLRDEYPRRRGGNGYASRFSSAKAVKYGYVLVGRDDLAEGGQRCADEVGSAHQFLTAIRIDTINHQRQHVERIRHRAPGECEPAFDLVKI